MTALTKRLLSGIVLVGCFLGVPLSASSQSNPGITIFSGVDRKDQLDYYLDFGGRPGGWDRYRLRVPGNRLQKGVAKFIIQYPDYFDGKFDTDSMEVRLKDESLPLKSAKWDKQSLSLEIELAQPIEELQKKDKVEIVLSNVKNPQGGGTFYFNCNVLAINDIPVPMYVGTWIVTIDN